MAVDIESLANGDTHTIRLIGEFTAETGERIRRAIMTLCTRQVPRIVIDMTDVGYIDSAGLGTLVERHEAITAYGGTMTVIGISERNRRIFELTRLSHLFIPSDT